MPVLATWIREVDDAAFRQWFAQRPGLDVRNARLLHNESSGLGAALPDAAAGLLLSGGPDIAAGFLRQSIPDPSVIEAPDPERDQWEFAALQAALAKGLPVLAICKGVQVLNVQLGGTLHLDIPDHADPACRDGNLQTLRYAGGVPSTRRFDRVNSSHHQALDRLGDGLQVEAWHAADDIIEQVSLPGHPYCVGVQYHPERHLQYAPLFQEFFSRLAAGSPRAT